MKKLLGLIIMIAGVVGGLYVGLWLLFIQPIVQACAAFDAGTLSATIIGWTVVKCVLASFVGGILFWLGTVIGSILLND
jgi:hypothetical protein